MAITYVDYTATGGQTDFDFTFPYLEDEHVKVEINGADTTDFTIVASPSTKVVLDSGATAGDKVRVRRRSAPNQNLVDFVNGSVLTESELDLFSFSLPLLFVPLISDTAVLCYRKLHLYIR